SIGEAYEVMQAKNYTHFINLDPNSKTFFLKTILGGMFITIAMTGLDQEMMQKNISVDNLQNSKKNMLTFAGTLLIVNLAFLFLGGLLYLYAMQEGGSYSADGFFMAQSTQNIMGDDMFPALSLSGSHFPMIISIIFIIGLISALFPSADGALTAVTSSYCVDLLNINEDNTKTEKEKKKIRIRVHLIFTIVFFILIMMFKVINNKSIVYLVMEVAGYTYGPLLGLFAFGILTKRNIYKKYSIITVAILAPIFTYIINELVINFSEYRIGVELIILNGLLTFIGLWLVSSNRQKELN
ncbi:MAG: sodium:solute symporter, partial [Algoriella sp.]